MTNFFDQDAGFSCHGLDAVTVTGPDGALTGLWNEYDQETPYDRELPRFISTNEHFIVLEVATAERGTLARGSTVTRDGQRYLVREMIRIDDGRITEVYLVPNP